MGECLASLHVKCGDPRKEAILHGRTDTLIQYKTTYCSYSKQHKSYMYSYTHDGGFKGAGPILSQIYEIMLEQICHPTTLF
jgi:hypothetical protein